MKSGRRATPQVIKATALLGMAALLIAGCASKKSSNVAAPTAAATTAASTAAAVPAAGPSGPVTVAVKTGPLGTYLTDANGDTLYLYTPDTTSTSTCYGECVANWPALLTNGGPAAGTGAIASLLGTSQRTDGTTQVTYNRHPLYLFKGDPVAGNMNGQGKAGTWFMLSGTGVQIGK
jgi:predicted lipoprotein with Yx(FWY)xxD motif